MRSLARLTVGGLLLAALAWLALPRTAAAELVVAPAEAPNSSSDADVDVVLTSPTDEVRTNSCTAVCLQSGEDPYRCEEDCVFVTEDATDVAAHCAG